MDSEHGTLMKQISDVWEWVYIIFELGSILPKE